MFGESARVMSEQMNENSFTPAFLASLSEMDLVVLQHELRAHPEDRESLSAVLLELRRRDRLRWAVVKTERS
jgi:hypothetical protein